MIRLIVNADDLGRSPRRDRGIFAAFREGIVTSASLLANGSSFELAAREALACALPVGVHINLSEGHALNGPIPGLTDAAGCFPGKLALRTILDGDPLDRDAVRGELLAQVDLVRNTGIEPDHLDTHQHCLLFPALTGIVAEVAETCGIRALRLPQPVAADGEAGQSVPSDELTAELACYRRLAPATRQVLHARGLWTPDGLLGMSLLNRLDTASLAAMLSRLTEGTWELMTHPGGNDPDDPFGGPEREAELAALTAPAIRQLLAERGIELTCFGACACTC